MCCAHYSFNFIHPEYFEGQAPRGSGLLCTKGTLYRQHEIECPACGVQFISTPLSDLRAEFGKKFKCELCKHEFVYTRAGREPRSRE